MQTRNLRKMMTPEERIQVAQTNALARYLIATIEDASRTANARFINMTRVIILTSNINVLLTELMNREGTPEELTDEQCQKIETAFDEASAALS